MYRLFFKRFFDFIIALTALLIFSPLFIIITIWLLVANRGTPFFVQRRPGKGERIFSIIKFKSMNDNRDEEGNLLPDAQRMTSVGLFIRKTSLDELPQLINVIKGDMSLIGPRPLLEQYLPFYTHREKLRHTVRPGITGYAQVNGRNKLDWDERLEFDAQYVENLSPVNDLKILAKTVKNVATRKDIVVVPGQFLQSLDEKRENENNLQTV